MSCAINTSTILCVKAEACANSEMTSQMLFGERCRILGEKDNWVKIQNTHDNHIGWVKRGGLQFLSDEDMDSIATQPLIRVCMPVADVFCLTDKTIHRFTMGSIIPNYDANTSKFEVGGKVYQIHSSFITHLPGFNKEGLASTAIALMNTPHLDGGRNMMGMDNSGFIQTVFTVNGFDLPRRIERQKDEGKTITKESITIGDLLFFENTTTHLVHVAMYLGENRIIHVDEKVKIHMFDIKEDETLTLDDKNYVLSVIKHIL